MVRRGHQILLLPPWNGALRVPCTTQPWLDAKVSAQTSPQQSLLPAPLLALPSKDAHGQELLEITRQSVTDQE